MGIYEWSITWGVDVMRIATVAALIVAGFSSVSVQAVTPIHAYEFNGGVNDSVGGANGTLAAGAYVAAGRLELDGIDDHVSFASHLVPTSGAYSVFVRLNALPNPGNYTEIISQGFSGGPGFYIGTAPAGGIRLTDTFTFTGLVFPAGEVELLLTSGGGGTRFYIDGTLVFSNPAAAGNGAGGSFTTFGRQFGGYGEYLRASIDAIRIYDSVILPGDVVGGIPEPAAWAMLLSGFGLTGAVLRRRQRALPA